MATTTSPFFPYCRRIRHESVRTDRQLSDDVRRPPARATTTTTTTMMMMISIVIRGFPDRAARYIVSDETISYIEAYRRRLIVLQSSHLPPPPRRCLVAICRRRRGGRGRGVARRRVLIPIEKERQYECGMHASESVEASRRRDASPFETVREGGAVGVEAGGAWMLAVEIGLLPVVTAVEVGIHGVLG